MPAPLKMPGMPSLEPEPWQLVPGSSPKNTPQAQPPEQAPRPVSTPAPTPYEPPAPTPYEPPVAEREISPATLEGPSVGGVPLEEPPDVAAERLKAGQAAVNPLTHQITEPGGKIGGSPFVIIPSGANSAAYGGLLTKKTYEKEMSEEERIFQEPLGRQAALLHGAMPFGSYNMLLATLSPEDKAIALDAEQKYGRMTDYFKGSLMDVLTPAVAKGLGLSQKLLTSASDRWALLARMRSAGKIAGYSGRSPTLARSMEFLSAYDRAPATLTGMAIANGANTLIDTAALGHIDPEAALFSSAGSFFLGQGAKFVFSNAPVFGGTSTGIYQMANSKGPLNESLLRIARNRELYRKYTLDGQDLMDSAADSLSSGSRVAYVNLKAETDRAVERTRIFFVRARAQAREVFKGAEREAMKTQAPVSAVALVETLQKVFDERFGVGAGGKAAPGASRTAVASARGAGQNILDAIQYIKDAAKGSVPKKQWKKKDVWKQGLIPFSTVIEAKAMLAEGADFGSARPLKKFAGLTRQAWDAVDTYIEQLDPKYVAASRRFSKMVGGIDNARGYFKEGGVYKASRSEQKVGALGIENVKGTATFKDVPAGPETPGQAVTGRGAEYDTEIFPGIAQELLDGLDLGDQKTTEAVRMGALRHLSNYAVAVESQGLVNLFAKLRKPEKIVLALRKMSIDDLASPSLRIAAGRFPQVAEALDTVMNLKVAEQLFRRASLEVEAAEPLGNVGISGRIRPGSANVGLYENIGRPGTKVAGGKLGEDALNHPIKFNVEAFVSDMQRIREGKEAYFSKNPVILAALGVWGKQVSLSEKAVAALVYRKLRNDPKFAQKTLTQIDQTWDRVVDMVGVGTKKVGAAPPEQQAEESMGVPEGGTINMSSQPSGGIPLPKRTAPPSASGLSRPSLPVR